MAASPRIEVTLSYAGEDEGVERIELITTKYQLQSARAISQERDRKGDATTYYAVTEDVLRHMSNVPDFDEQIKVAFPIIAVLNECRIPHDQHYMLTLDLITMLGIQLNELIKRALAVYFGQPE